MMKLYFAFTVAEVHEDKCYRQSEAVESSA